MQLVIEDKTALKKAITNLYKIAGAGRLEILGKILVTASESAVAFSATDMEIDGRVELNTAEASEQGSALVDAKTLYDAIRKLKGRSLAMRTAPRDNGEVLIVSAGSSQELEILALDQSREDLQVEIYTSRFETPGEDSDVVRCATRPGVIHNAFKIALGAIGKDPARTNLHFLEVIATETGVELASTDGHRAYLQALSLEELSVDAGDLKKLLDAQHLSIPRRMIEMAQRSFSPKGEITIAITDGSSLLLEQDGITLGCDLIKDKLPNIRAVTSTPPCAKVAFCAEALEGHLDLLKQFSGKTNRVKVSHADDVLEFQTLSPGEGIYRGRVSTRFDHSETDPLKPFIINIAYLKDLLSAVDFEDVQVGVTPDNGPLHFRSPARPGDLFVIMPMLR